MSDSAKLHTGFARVTKNVFTYLARTGKYEIVQIGWFHQETNETCVFPIWKTNKDDKGRTTHKDKYAHDSFPEFVDKFKPDLVWTLGDSLAENRIIPFKINGRIELLTFEDFWQMLIIKYNLIPSVQVQKDQIEREFINLNSIDILTMSHLGWKKLKVVSRHYYEGSLANIVQPQGHTVCTHNHSVMVKDGNKIKKAKPAECLQESLANLEQLDNIFINNKKCSYAKARLYGAYVSEGSATDTSCGKRIRISSTNRKWLEELQDDVESEYGKRGCIETNKCDFHGNKYVCYNLVIYGQDIYKEFVSSCGRYCEGKKVPPLVLNGTPKIIREFLKLAYEGDGYKGTEISYTTKSLKLASGISFLYKMLGQHHSIRYREEKEAYTIRHIYKERNVGVANYSVNNLQYSGYVYDLTVEEAKTFVDALGCIICSNTWMTDHVADSPNRNTFKWIGYFPIDGEPVPSKWEKPVKNMDIAVAYGEWGKRVISHRAPRANLTHIYHGVDTHTFYPREEELRKKEKENILGAKSTDTIIGVVARNQPRKAFDKLFEAYFYTLNGMYIKCNKCNKLTVHKYDIISKTFDRVRVCKHCLSDDVSQGKPKKDVKLYLHAAAVDCGWDLIDLQRDYNLGGHVLINPALKIGVGVSDSTLCAIYNTFDIFTLPTRGEGFGLPILEAMACGVPVVITDYSAPTEWAKGCGELIPPVALVAEPLTNIKRAVIDVDLYVTSLVKLIEDPELRKKYGDAGAKRAKEMGWDNIVKKWEKMIDGVLYPGQEIKETIKPHEIEYSLEVA